MAVDFDAVIKNGDQAKGTLLDLDWPRTVEREEGDLIWLSDSKLEGWVRKDAVETIDEALKRRTELVRQNPSADNYGNRGLVWFGKGEFKFAIKDYTKAIRLEKEERRKGVWHWNRGEARLAQDDAMAAIEDLDKAIKLMADRPLGQYEAFRLRAAAHEKVGNKQAAEADRRIAEEIRQVIRR